MSNVQNNVEVDNIQLNARVVDYYKEIDLEPLRELFDVQGPDGWVDDISEMIELLNSILYMPNKLKFNRSYLQDRMYAMNTLRKHFTDLERSTIKKVAAKIDVQELFKAS